MSTNTAHIIYFFMFSIQDFINSWGSQGRGSDNNGA